MPGCCIAADRDTAPILPTSTSYWSASFRHLPDQPIDYVVLVWPGECVRPDHQVLSGLRLFEYVFRSVLVLTHVVVALLQLIAQPLPKRLVQLIAKLKLQVTRRRSLTVIEALGRRLLAKRSLWHDR